MDPNACLEEIRSLIIKRRHSGDDSSDDRFFELVEALDQWISRGGFKPIAWNVEESYINPVSGKLKQLRNLEEVFDYLEWCGPEYKKDRERVRNLLNANPKAQGLVIFENLQLDSSEVGQRSVLLVGSTWACKSIEQAAQRHLYDLPSQRQYPRAYYERVHS